MVLGHEGALEESQNAYDKKVAGVVSGAGTFSRVRDSSLADRRNRLPNVPFGCARDQSGELQGSGFRPIRKSGAVGDFVSSI